MNDTYGHEVGDLWIKGAALAIKHAFGKSRVYRIGGDEFVVILKNGDCKYYNRMSSDFQSEIVKFNAEDKVYKEKLQIACGIAEYDKTKDMTYADTFRRADTAMYENKKYLKSLS